MDIKSINPNLANNRLNETSNGGQKGSAAATTSSEAKSTDKVTLTSVTDLEQKAQSASVDNSKRIEELKAAIKDGSYQVDAEKVAKKLIQTEVLFAGT